MDDSLWNRTQKSLDEDQRMVFPEMFYENRGLYGDIRDVVHLVKYEDGTVTWIRDCYIGSARYDAYGPYTILAKLFIVDIRLPWTVVHGEHIIDSSQFNNYRDRYQILDVLLRVKNKRGMIITVGPTEWELHRDAYELIDIRYLVTERNPPVNPKPPLNIDKEKVNTYIPF